MSITKKLLPLSMVASLLIFTACGGGGDSTPKNETPSETKNVTVPKKISIVIPDALKNKRSADENIGKLSISKSQNSIESYGYQQLQSTISRAEETIESVKENMKYLTLMMPDIVKACADTAENTKCTIPSGEIELTVEGQTFSMGEILYTQQDSTKKYQQIVVLDLKPTLEEMGETLEKDLETVKWSTDENHIETISDFKDNDGTFNMHLIYDKESDGKSTMNITDSFKFGSDKGTFMLNIADKNDINNTVDVTMNGTFTEEFEGNILSDTYNMVGSVNKNGGYLTSTGTFLEDKFSEKETFDKDGKLLQSKFCASITGTDDSCQHDDDSTWHTFDDALGLDNSEFEEDNNLPNTHILKIEGGNFKDGIYFLIPDTLDITNISTNEYEDNAVAYILVFSTEDELFAHAYLNNPDYISKLNDLRLIYIGYDNFGNYDESSISIVNNSDKPIFSVFSF